MADDGWLGSSVALCVLMVPMAADARASAAPPVPPAARIVPDEPGAGIDPTLAGAHGPVNVVLQLTNPSLSASVADDAVAQGTLPSAGVQRATVAAATRQQDGVVAPPRRSAPPSGPGSAARSTPWWCRPTRPPSPPSPPSTA